MRMDAVEFVNKMNRMCAKYPDCVGCPIETENEMDDCLSKVPADQMVDIVEKWANEHPIKTRQSEFLKMFPNVDLDSDGVINILPCRMDTKNYRVNANGGGCKTAPCVICKQEFWSQEVE